MSNLLKGILNEEVDFADKVDKWKEAVKKQYPNEASKLKFKSANQATKISAEIPGKDRCYGVFCLKSGKGEVLGEEVVPQEDLDSRKEMLLSLDEAAKRVSGEGELQPEIEDLIGREVEIKFPTKGTLSNYFASIYLQGIIVKFDEAKKLFVVEHDHLRMNDETMAGGPGGKYKPYKSTFNIKDIDYIDEHPHHIRIEMKS